MPALCTVMLFIIFVEVRVIQAMLTMPHVWEVQSSEQAISASNYGRASVTDSDVIMTSYPSEISLSKNRDGVQLYTQYTYFQELNSIIDGRVPMTSLPIEHVPVSREILSNNHANAYALPMFSSTHVDIRRLATPVGSYRTINSQVVIFTTEDINNSRERNVSSLFGDQRQITIANQKIDLPSIDLSVSSPIFPINYWETAAHRAVSMEIGQTSTQFSSIMKPTHTDHIANKVLHSDDTIYIDDATLDGYKKMQNQRVHTEHRRSQGNSIVSQSLLSELILNVNGYNNDDIQASEVTSLPIAISMTLPYLSDPNSFNNDVIHVSDVTGTSKTVVMSSLLFSVVKTSDVKMLPMSSMSSNTDVNSLNMVVNYTFSTNAGWPSMAEQNSKYFKNNKKSIYSETEIPSEILPETEIDSTNISGVIELTSKLINQYITPTKTHTSLNTTMTSFNTYVAEQEGNPISYISKQYTFAPIQKPMNEGATIKQKTGLHNSVGSINHVDGSKSLSHSVYETDHFSKPMTWTSSRINQTFHQTFINVESSEIMSSITLPKVSLYANTGSNDIANIKTNLPYFLSGAFNISYGSKSRYVNSREFNVGNLSSEVVMHTDIRKKSRATFTSDMEERVTSTYTSLTFEASNYLTSTEMIAGNSTPKDDIYPQSTSLYHENVTPNLMTKANESTYGLYTYGSNVDETRLKSASPDVILHELRPITRMQEATSSTMIITTDRITTPEVKKEKEEERVIESRMFCAFLCIRRLIPVPPACDCSLDSWS